jgi:hypothetical protein
MNNFNICLEARGKENTQRLLATMALGLVEAVRSGAMRSSDACGLFFIPAFLRLSDTLDIDPRIENALHIGSELADIEEIAPNGFNGALNDISRITREFLQSLGNSPAPLEEKWLKSVVVVSMQE